MNKVSEIKNRVTMWDVLAKYGFEQKKRMKCPLHTGDDLNFAVKDHSYMCFSHCGGGDVITFVQKLFGLSFPDALKKIDTDFNLGLFEQISNRKSLDIARKSHHRKKERERKKQEIEDAKNRYWVIFDEWVRLDRNKTLYAPKTPDEECHPLFVEALKKLAYQEYLLDCAESELYEIEHGNSTTVHG